ncbi:hypothetical protein PSN13_05184 [Micromonospora saelicesensis]|uniref:Histidine kinase-, DNA gyrase B-, and HSP90-like ATPase n=1 Tax=Micromonospora saelicesensis TaxID=285676 RepID=A0A328NL53_9ACTN|nr:ATP-binding protein [Micromonospora saelicesensis]RAO29985.1 hypothetical protein PSN13_05184 [Micromonospora saelicesensis]
MRREEIIPSAARLTNSLRDLGYEFSSAVADLIDNSVAAGAGRVSITIHFDGPDSWIRIADDGAGMTGASISEAMRLGAARDYGEGDLGKFGLGLKTASLSQCRIISVASRTATSRRRIEARRLDLGHVTETDRWEILHLTGAERPEPLIAPLKEATGTVVMWESLDRVLSYRDPWGGWAQRHLMELAEQLEFHLGMVFGRFLSGQARRRKRLHITINGTPVEAWDPFVRAESRTESLPGKEFQVAGGLVRFSPFVVPAQREFSSDAAWRRASGPQNWNRQQGFYVYRADRMIQSGGWSRMRTQDEHAKLARASLEFWPDLDEAFEINISKMRVRLPEDLRDQLNRPVAELVKRAQERYRGGDKSRSPRPRPPSGSPPPPPPSRSGGVPTPVDGERRSAGPEEAWSATAPAGGGGNGSGAVSPPSGGPGGQGSPVTLARPTAVAALQRAAERAGHSDALESILDQLRRDDPEVARELGL